MTLNELLNQSNLYRHVRLYWVWTDEVTGHKKRKKVSDHSIDITRAQASRVGDREVVWWGEEMAPFTNRPILNIDINKPEGKGNGENAG